VNNSCDINAQGLQVKEALAVQKLRVVRPGRSANGEVDTDTVGRSVTAAFWRLLCIFTSFERFEHLKI